MVGTHALLEPDVEFHRLALCVIDEEHRFGQCSRPPSDNSAAADALTASRSHSL